MRKMYVLVVLFLAQVCLAGFEFAQPKPEENSSVFTFSDAEEDWFNHNQENRARNRLPRGSDLPDESIYSEDGLSSEKITQRKALVAAKMLDGNPRKVLQDRRAAYEAQPSATTSGQLAAAESDYLRHVGDFVHATRMPKKEFHQRKASIFAARRNREKDLSKKKSEKLPLIKKPTLKRRWRY